MLPVPVTGGHRIVEGVLVLLGADAGPLLVQAGCEVVQIVVQLVLVRLHA